MIHFLYNYFLVQQKVNERSTVFKRLHWMLYKFLKKGLFNYYKKLPVKKLKTSEDSNVIVSLTSIPERIDKVPIVVKSMLNQTYKPLKVVLWLGQEKFPNRESGLPDSLLVLKDYGLEIEFCEDLKPHTKYFYAFKKYPNHLIVTVDDDLFYPVNMLEKLMEFHSVNPNCVIANRVREIAYAKDKIKHYRTWQINRINHSLPSNKLLATGVSGVLYRPNLFKQNLFNTSKIKELALNVDDIWLKANEIVSDLPVVFTNYFFNPFIEIANSQKSTLNSENVFNGGNNVCIKETFSFFGINEKSFE